MTSLLKVLIFRIGFMSAVLLASLLGPGMCEVVCASRAVSSSTSFQTCPLAAPESGEHLPGESLVQSALSSISRRQARELQESRDSESSSIRLLSAATTESKQPGADSLTANATKFSKEDSSGSPSATLLKTMNFAPQQPSAFGTRTIPSAAEVATEATVDANIAMQAALAAKLAAEKAADTLEKALHDAERQKVEQEVVQQQQQDFASVQVQQASSIWEAVAALLGLLMIVALAAALSLYATQTRSLKSSTSRLLDLHGVQTFQSPGLVPRVVQSPVDISSPAPTPPGFGTVCRLVTETDQRWSCEARNEEPPVTGPQPAPVLCGNLIVPSGTDRCFVVPPLLFQTTADGSNSGNASVEEPSREGPEGQDRQMTILDAEGAEVFNAIYASNTFSLSSASSGQIIASARLKSSGESLTIFDGQLGEPFGELELVQTIVGSTYRFSTPHGERLTIRGNGNSSFNFTSDDGRLLGTVEPSLPADGPRRSLVVRPGADAGLVVLCVLGVECLQGV